VSEPGEIVLAPKERRVALVKMVRTKMALAALKNLLPSFVAAADIIDVGQPIILDPEEARLVESEILAGLHAPLSNFGRAARQSTSVLICLGLAHAPSFLRAICSIPSFGIAKVAANVCSPYTNTIPTNGTAGIG
jgi:hypothetical protein